LKTFCIICNKEIKDGVVRLMQPGDKGINHFHETCHERQKDFKGVSDFIKEKCLMDEKVRVEGKILYDEWLGFSGVHGNRGFYTSLKNLGFVVKKSTNNKLFVFGIALKSGD
jgi:hypothetical protein